MATTDNPIGYKQILAALRMKREQIDEVIISIERLARDEEKEPERRDSRAVRAVPDSAPTSAKRHISAEGRKRIVAAAKKRWRLIRAAKKAAGTETGGRKRATKKSG